MLSFDGEQLHLLMYLCHGADFNTADSPWLHALLKMASCYKSGLNGIINKVLSLCSSLVLSGQNVCHPIPKHRVYKNMTVPGCEVQRMENTNRADVNCLHIGILNSRPLEKAEPECP